MPQPDGSLVFTAQGVPGPNGVPQQIAVTSVDAHVKRVDAYPFTTSLRCTVECAGITIGAPNAAGERTIAFDASVLRELEPAALPGDRSMTLVGSFVAPPP